MALESPYSQTTPQKTFQFMVTPVSIFNEPNLFPWVKFFLVNSQDPGFLQVKFLLS